MYYGVKQSAPCCSWLLLLRSRRSGRMEYCSHVWLVLRAAHWSSPPFGCLGWPLVSFFQPIEYLC